MNVKGFTKTNEWLIKYTGGIKGNRIVVWKQRKSKSVERDLCHNERVSALNHDV